MLIVGCWIRYRAPGNLLVFEIVFPMPDCYHFCSCWKWQQNILVWAQLIFRVGALPYRILFGINQVILGKNSFGNCKEHDNERKIKKTGPKTHQPQFCILDSSRAYAFNSSQQQLTMMYASYDIVLYRNFSSIFFHSTKFL